MGSDGGAMASDPAVAFKSYFVPQGISADLIATKYGYSRDDADAYAVESQNRAKAAWDDNRFEKSIVPVKDVVAWKYWIMMSLCALKRRCSLLVP